MSKKFLSPKVLSLTVAIGSDALPPKIDCHEALQKCIQWKNCGVLIVKNPLAYEEFFLGREICKELKKSSTGSITDFCKSGCKSIEEHSLCSIPCNG